MNKPIKFFLACLFTVVAIKNSSAQGILPDSLQQLAYNKIVANYYTTIGPQAHIYNGPAYRFHPNTIRGNAYFKDDIAWKTGSVVYDSVYYDNVQIMYDIYDDAVALLSLNKYQMMTLQKDRLSGFSFSGYNFVNYTNKTTAIKPGIYLQLYSGKVEALAKYSKNLQSAASTSGPPEQYFEFSKSYYIKKDSTYHKAESEGAVLKVFNDRKKELKQFIKNKNIKFKKNPEQAIAMIAAEYDRITD